MIGGEGHRTYLQMDFNIESENKLCGLHTKATHIERFA